MNKIIATLIWTQIFFAATLEVSAAISTSDSIQAIGQSSLKIEPDEMHLVVDIDLTASRESNVIELFRSSYGDLQELLVTTGVHAGNIEIISFEVHANPQAEGQPVETFQVESKIGIVISVSDKNGALLDALQRQTEATISRMKYSHSDAKQLQLEADRLAIQDAIRRIRDAAQASGLFVDHVIAIRYFTSNIRPQAQARFAAPHESERSAVPLETGEIEYRSEMEVVMELVSSN